MPEIDAGDEPEGVAYGSHQATEEDEPSLGSLDMRDQSRWAEGSCDDREDGDDNGIADHGGDAEQRGAVWFGCADELCSVTGQPLVWNNGRLVAERWA